MTNEVNISGLVKSIKEDGGKYVATVEVVRRYGADRQSSNMYNIILPAGGGLARAFEWAQEKNKPLYASFRGVLANRKFAEGDKYANHTLIVAMSVGAMGTGSDGQWASAAFAGEVKFAKFQYTAKGTPFVRVLLRNTRVVKVRGEEKEFSSSVFVTIYDVDEDQRDIFKKGTKMAVFGRLESYEASDSPGSYITTMTADDYYPLGVLDVNAVADQTKVVEESIEDEVDEDDDDILAF